MKNKGIKDKIFLGIVLVFVLLIVILLGLAIYKNITGHAIEDIGTVCEGIVDIGDLSGCTRTRFGVLPAGIDKIPSAGLRVIGADWNTNTTGTSMGRNIIQWYHVYGSDGEGDLNLTWLDNVFEGYHDSNLKLILTLRSNHPTKSEVSFDTDVKTLLQPDSYPKDEQEWVNYLKNITERYYVNATENVSGVLVAIQIGNEWSHQFEVNSSYGRWTESTKDDAVLSLMNLSYSTIKDLAPTLPVISFATSGTPDIALGAGFNEQGWRYRGNYYNLDGTNGISTITQDDINPNAVTLFQRAVVEGAPYYDYFDTHIYFQPVEGARYVANFVRSTWLDNDITNKGLISTEFAAPVYNYSYDLHSDIVKSAEAVAYHSGYDSIIWANWNPAQTSPNILQSSLKTCSSNNILCYRFEQIGNYSSLQNYSIDFNNVTRNNGLFTFEGAGYVNEINIVGPSFNYPSLYQCSDGIDNDHDGNIDSADSECLTASYCNSTQNIEDINCVDPLGYSESNWIFIYPDVFIYPDPSTPINVTILYPINQSIYSTSSIELNYTFTNADFCWYNLNYGSNVTLSECENTTLILDNGQYNLTVYGNNTDFIGSDAIYFSVSIDEESGNSGGGSGSGSGGSGGDSGGSQNPESIGGNDGDIVFFSPGEVERICIPDWKCEWNRCKNRIQNLNSCKDLNNCDVEYEGVEEQSCVEVGLSESINNLFGKIKSVKGKNFILIITALLGIITLTAFIIQRIKLRDDEKLGNRV